MARGSDHVGSIGDVPTHKGIENERVVWSYGVAYCAVHPEVFGFPLRSVTGSKSKKPLLCRESFFAILLCCSSCRDWVDGETEPACISRDTRPGGATQQSIDGLIPRFALEIPPDSPQSKMCLNDRADPDATSDRAVIP